MNSPAGGDPREVPHPVEMHPVEMHPVESGRRAELAAALVEVRTRVAAAAEHSGRPPAAVTLIAITKSFPLLDLQILLDLGVEDIGESRDQEARAKLAALPFGPLSEVSSPTFRVHFIGQLQTNKCNSVTRYADSVHSVDRPELITALARGAERAGREINIFLQVNLDSDVDHATRGGVGVGELLPLADLVGAHPQLRLRGVMAVAPLVGGSAEAFDRLRQLSTTLQAQHPEAKAISAGMSGDYEAAIRFGATHVRVGSALLGQRVSTIG